MLWDKGINEFVKAAKFLKNNGVKIHDFSKQRNVPNAAIEHAIKSLKSSDGNISTDVRGSLELRKSIGS